MLSGAGAWGLFVGEVRRVTPRRGRLGCWCSPRPVCGGGRAGRRAIRRRWVAALRWTAPFHLAPVSRPGSLCPLRNARCLRRRYT
eukprot:3369543-Prymnesium_polylepis.1